MRRIAIRPPSILAFALLLFVGFAAAPRGAAAQQQGAEAFIQNLGNHAMQMLAPSVPAGVRTAEFRQLFERDFDMSQITRFVLGPAGRSLSPPRRAEFRRLLADYLAREYAERLKSYAGASFQVFASRPWGDGTMVYSRVVQRDGKPINLDWEVVDSGGQPQISDVYVDRVSMKLTTRNELAGVMQRNGGDPDAMLAALRQQLAFGS